MKNLLFIALLSICQCASAQVTRGEILIDNDAEKEVIGKYHALLFSVEHYEDDKIADLNGPLADANRFKTILSNKYGFTSENIEVISDPSRAQIMEALIRNKETLKKEDNLIVFFGGHGIWNQDSLMGYWLPSDYKSGDVSSGVANWELKQILGEIKSRHVLLISDACYSGSIFRGRSLNELDGFKKQLFLSRSRKAMTSGMLQAVPEKSIFMEKLMTYLEKNPSKYLLAQELFFSIQRDVAQNQMSASKKSIVPLYAPITGCDDQNGEFIFYNETGGLDDVTAISFTKPSFQRFAQRSMAESVSLGKIFQFPETPLEFLGNARVYEIMGMVNESAKAYLNYFALSVDEMYIDPHLEMIKLLDEIDTELKERYIEFISKQDNAFFDFLMLKINKSEPTDYAQSLNQFIVNNPEFSLAKLEFALVQLELAKKNNWQPMIGTIMSIDFASRNLEKEIAKSKKTYLRRSDFDTYFTKSDQEMIISAVNQIPVFLKSMIANGDSKEHILKMSKSIFSPQKDLSEQEISYLSELIDALENKLSNGSGQNVSFDQYGLYCAYYEGTLDTVNYIDVQSPKVIIGQPWGRRGTLECAIHKSSNSTKLVLTCTGDGYGRSYSVAINELIDKSQSPSLSYYLFIKNLGGLKGSFVSDDASGAQTNIAIANGNMTIKEGANSVTYEIERYGNGLFTRIVTKSLEQYGIDKKEYAWVKLFDILSEKEIQITDPDSGTAIRYIKQ